MFVPGIMLQAASGTRASTSGRLPAFSFGHCHVHAGAQPTPMYSCKPRSATAVHTTRHNTNRLSPPVRCGSNCHKAKLVKCQAQKNQQESERPVMEQVESDLIAGSSNGNGNSSGKRNGNGNGARSNGSRAPLKNSATNIADKTESQPAEESQDEGDNSDAGAQSHSERSNGTPAKAASKVPGGVTEADNINAPKPASFWLPHPEPGDIVQVYAKPRLVCCKPLVLVPMGLLSHILTIIS